MLSTEPHGVEFWVKRYEINPGNMYVTTGFKTRDEAYQFFDECLTGNNCYFIQMGARSTSNPCEAIVLNEYRRPATEDSFIKVNNT